MSNSLWPHGLHYTRLPCPSPTPGACSISCPPSQRCHPTILSSVISFSSCLESFPASGSIPVRKEHWRRKWQPTPVFLPAESHGQRSLVGYGSWGCEESDMTEQLTLSLSFPGGSHSKESACSTGDLDSNPGLGRSPREGNDNPLQCSGLENSIGRGTWQATIHRVTKNWTQLCNLQLSPC